MVNKFTTTKAKIYDKNGKSFNKWCWENQIATCIRMKVECSLTSHTKLSSRWIKDLNIRLGTIKLQEENMKNTL